MTATQPQALTPQLSEGPNPTVIFETLNRYQHTMALKGAIDLDLFTHIAAGADTASELATRCSASERGVRILCDFLTVMGFLQKTGNRYSLPPQSALFLDRQSPAYLGSISRFVTSPKKLNLFRDVAALVRKGGTIDGAGSLEPDAELWVEFARSMTPVVMPVAQALASRLSQPGRDLKVLDIAASHGMFGILIAQKNPRAEICSLDLPGVIDVALENAASAGVEERVHAIVGSAFDVDLGSEYDLVLIPNFLHHFNPVQNVALLSRVRAALKPGGRVATVEFVPNDDRVSPPVAASFSMMMLGNTQEGDAYTFRELDQMFCKAGFRESSLHSLPPLPMSLILSEV